MPMYFQKTENALKRAREFIEVDKKESALECLNDVIHSKKHRQTWTTTHELIMRLFVELCVDLQRSAFAKDGLYQYRNICRDVSLHSFEVVVKYFLKLANERANAAREESEQAVLQEVEDLDVIMTPENLLLSTVSGEGVKERSDRALLAPWVKFLWESYRNMLELLKNNNTIERVYADVAKDAFKFCLNYQRRTEFRKLCEILKNHLLQAQKYQSQNHSLRFENPDTIQFLVDIRFEQLECSINVDLWQEAFKAIEEIHNLLELSGKTPRPGLLDNYYSRQVKVYWMANNKLFHAAALHKLFVLWKEQKKTISSEELQRIASRVLLATLCVPIEPTPSDVDRFLEVDQTGRDKARRLAALLRMNTLPTRASLLKDINRHNIIQHSPPELQQLYSCLEVEFNPLQLSKKLTPILEGLEEDEILKQYIEPAREVMLVRLIKEVSQVYETVELDWLARLVPFTTPTHLETVVIETAHSNGIQVHIDHQTNCLRFGSDMSFSYRNETPEGPYVQPMPSEALCGQLQAFSAALQQAVQIITAKESEREHAATMRELAQAYLDHSRADHRDILARKQRIEARKEFIESESRAKENKENQERREKQNQERQAESDRLKREAEERAESKRKNEIAERKRIEREQRIESLKKTAVGVRALETITPGELDQMDVDAIVAKQLKQMEKEMREKETKLRTQEKKIDHWERAKRLAEIPLLEKQYMEQIEDDRAFHEQKEEERVTAEIKDRKEKEENRVRMGHMESSRDEFLDQIRLERHEAYLVKLKEFEAMLEVARVERMKKRKQERKDRRKAETAELKRAEEEKELCARKEAEKAKLEEERRIRQEELDAQLRKQREREEEIEAKQRRKDEEARLAMEERREKASRDGREWGGDSGQQGNWRRDEPERPQQKWRDTEREEGGGYPSPRTGAYHPPVRRDGGGGGGWRSRENEFQRGSERDDGDEPQRPHGILKGERGRGERDMEIERGVSWEDERKPPLEVQVAREEARDEEEGGRWRQETRDDQRRRPDVDGSPRTYHRDPDRRGYTGRDRDGEHDGYGGSGKDRERGFGGPRRERDPDRRGWGREDGDRDGAPPREGGDWRRDGDGDRGEWRGRESDRRGREGEFDRGWRGRESDRGGGGGWRGREGDDRGGWRGREGEDRAGDGWRGREGDERGGDRSGGWRGREGEDRGGGWRGGRRDGGYNRGDRGDRERDRDQGMPRQYEDQQRGTEERNAPRRDAWQRDGHEGGGSAWRSDGGGSKATSSPPSRDRQPPESSSDKPPRSRDEGWEVVGRKR